MLSERGQAELVHHPVGLDTLGSSALVENKGFLQANTLGALGGVDGSVSTRGFPKPSSGNPIRPSTVPVFPIPRAIEIPLFLSGTGQLYTKQVLEQTN